MAFAHSLASNSDKKLLIDGRVVKHEQIPYSKFDDYGNNDVFVLPEGNYYLEDDISLMYPLAVTGEVNLCLNGKQIIQNYTYGKGMRFPTVIVRRDATLNLCDCRPEGAVGKITHASDMMGSGIEVRGKFKDVTGEAGVLNLYNAEISGNKQTSAGAANGGGVYNKGVFNMYGGKITDNAHTNGGGVGNSGMGSYHGRQSFETFSHNRAIVDKATWIDLPMRYMPYKKLNDLLIRMFIH